MRTIFVVRICMAVLMTLGLFGSLASGALPVAAQLDPGAPGPEDLPDDIMPPPAGTSLLPGVPRAPYVVTPYVFVPNDVEPDPQALDAANQRMASVQRWYAEQLRGQTFTLGPAVLVLGQHPLAEYYGPYYVFTDETGGSRAHTLWNNIFADLAALGHPWQSNRVQVVFFQHNGQGGTALGGGQRALVSLNVYYYVADCQLPGCDFQVGTGGLAHELGHAFGLRHTLDDEQGSPGLSLMSWGFYSYPRITLVETSVNPERSTALASPFINTSFSPRDGGFEECGSEWAVTAGTMACAAERLSGLSSMQLTANGTNTILEQTIAAAAGQTVDISGWHRVSAASNDTLVTVRVHALLVSDTVLATETLAATTGQTAAWERFGGSIVLPVETVGLRIELQAAGTATTAYFDDIVVQPPLSLPVTPLHMVQTNGDEVPTLSPLLQWTDSTRSTEYLVQLATDDTFATIVEEARLSLPAYSVSTTLTPDQRYYWRVKAINGLGESEWSMPWGVIPRLAENYHSDEFESPELDDAWSIIREQPGYWGIRDGTTERTFGNLMIYTLQGDLVGNTNNAKNIFVRAALACNFSMSTITTYWYWPGQDQHQGGLIVYEDGDNFLQLSTGYASGRVLMLKAEVNGQLVSNEAMWLGDPATPIRIARAGDTFIGQYSPNYSDWDPIGQPVSVHWPQARIGLTAYNPLPSDGINAYFDWMRIQPYEGPAFSQVITPITANEDDAEEQDGSVELSSSDLEMVENRDRPQIVGMRFRNVQIPAGSTITRATIEFIAASAQSKSTSLTFYGEDVGNAAPIERRPHNLSARPHTDASISWNNVPAWSAGETGADTQTPNLAAIVQEIVDRADWRSGNAMLFIVDGSGKRAAISHNSNPAQAPLLVVEFTSATAVSNRMNSTDSQGDLYMPVIRR